MRVVEVLELVRLVVFAGTAAAGVVLWRRTRSRPSALLAVAFGILIAILVVSRLLPPSDARSGAAPMVRDLLVIGLAVFPWLLATFAWSFDEELPGWLVAASGWIVLVAGWILVLPAPAPPGQPRSAAFSLFVVVYVVGWSLLAVSAAVKLWRAGGAQPLTRARMRSMAVGVLVLTMALLLIGARQAESDGWAMVIHVLTIVSALWFTAGFAPPRALRVWWRRRATRRWHQVQADLIAAVTPVQVAKAAVPMLADVLGAGVAVVDRNGHVLAAAGLDDPTLERLAASPPGAASPHGRDSWVALDGTWLVVTATPHTPLFGADEQDIIAGNAMQLRLALERAELFVANEHTRRQLERQHGESQAMLAGLAHDLRGPIGAVAGFTQLLRDDDLDPDDHDHLLDRVDANIGHLSALAGAVVELARAGRTHADRTLIDLNQTLATVTDRVRQRHPHLRVHVDPLPSVIANPLAMEQVFDNLLTNAARYAHRDDPTVTISAYHDDTSTIIDVVDNGPGIPADEHDLVFAPFQRGRDAQTPGAGIGLGLVRRLVHSHGGDITLLDPPTGAHFRIRLPRPVDTVAPSAAEVTTVR